MPSVTATISDFNLTSTWTNTNGSMTTPTTVDMTKQFTISGIPANGVVTSAKIAVTVGSPFTGAAIRKINNKNANTGAYEADIDVTENGTYYVAFQFKANGDPTLSNGSHSSSCSFNSITITVTYEEGETPPEPSGTVTASIADFNLNSSWTLSNHAYTTRPTQTTATKQFTVSGLPDGAVIQTAVFTVAVSSPLSGIALLRINDQAAVNGNYSQDVKHIVTGNGTYEFTFVFKANGDTTLSDGSHVSSLPFTNATITITYEDGTPAPPPDPDVISSSARLVCLFDPMEKRFNGNGICVLSPTKCTVTETAGGEYELEMEHLYDPYGKYLMLVEDYIIRAPVPPMVIPEVTIPASSVWNVKSNITSTPLYSRLPSYNQSIAGKISQNPSTFMWDSQKRYPKGEHVLYTNNKIYQAKVTNTGYAPSGHPEVWEFVCNLPDPSDPETTPSGGSYDPGTIIENIAGGASVTKLADYSATYMKVRSALGKVGYIKRADCEETATDPEGTVVPSRTIIDQLFRIYSVSSEDDTHTVKVSARHISYDYQKNALYDCQLNETDPATAIALIQGSLMYEDNRLIACDMTQPTIKADYSFQNPVQALLDPDEGVAGQLRAKVLRDNEDIFILDNSNPRQGPGITYGVNLRGVSWERNIEDIVTRIIPRADDGNKGKLYLDELFVDSPNIDDFAVISIEVLDSEYSVGQKIEKADGTEITLTREDVLQRMREEAEKRYSVDKCDAVLVTLDVQFLLLGDTEQYKQYKDLQRVNIYDQITVKTGPSGMEITAQVTGYEWDCLMRRYNEITVGRIYGQNRRQVAGFQMATGAITYSKLAPGLISKLKGDADNG